MHHARRAAHPQALGRARPQDLRSVTVGLRCANAIRRYALVSKKFSHSEQFSLFWGFFLFLFSSFLVFF